ncbi:phage tail spike protein [Bacillus infantis]|uniref:phage tail spike protein n=1 Tax=Bacillus infantis TaxID=324767 RepID=UPI003CEB7BB3
MYKVYSDAYLLYDDRLESLRINNAKLDLELNKTGSFEFTIYPDHPYYGMIHKLKSIITVFQDDFLVFRGRVLNDDIGFHDEKQVVCEGQLAFLLDSIQRPYDYSGSISGFLQQLISAHNSQVETSHQFTLGNVTVTDPNDTIARSDIDYKSTWEVIEKKLIELLGGYIVVRNEGNVNYIDYLSDFSMLASQSIEFAKNLLDMKRIRKGEDISTALIPLGAKLKDAEGNDTDTRLTIESINEGLDYIYDEDAVEQYGWIFKTEIWDDVTDATNLLRKGQAHLAGITQSVDSLELSAADLAGIDASISSFHLGTYVRVISKPHGIEQNLLVNKISMDLLNPASNSLILGGVTEYFTKSTAGINASQNDLIHTVEHVQTSTSQAIYLVEKNMDSTIQQTSESILQTVSESYYQKDKTEELVAQVESSLEQTKDGFEMQFNQFNANLDDLASGTDTQFEEIKKYIRFIDGKILLGEAGNELELEIANDRISFLQNNLEVAYLSNNKLYVTDGEYTNSLRLGNFAFLPRANGNLSFKKI